ncbi:hypothetical protein ABIB94_002584 [Bradyrhizobium sp. JR7.2]
MTPSDRIYSFVFRGLLAKEAIDSVIAESSEPNDQATEDVEALLALDALTSGSFRRHARWHKFTF